MSIVSFICIYINNTVYFPFHFLQNAELVQQEKGASDISGSDVNIYSHDKHI